MMLLLCAFGAGVASRSAPLEEAAAGTFTWSVCGGGGTGAGG